MSSPLESFILNLTGAEVARFEDLSGIAINQISQADAPKGKALSALAFLKKRREELANGEKPSFTWNQAQDLTLGYLNEYLGLTEDDDADDPEDQDAETSKPKSRKKVVDDPKGD